MERTPSSKLGPFLLFFNPLTNYVTLGESVHLSGFNFLTGKMRIKILPKYLHRVVLRFPWTWTWTWFITDEASLWEQG